MHAPRIVTFGEILFDVFPDGAHLGGAPLNLSVHLHRQGAEVQVISAVGADEYGRQALAELRRQGLSTDAVATLDLPTGAVMIELDERKVPAYRFLEDCAYDHIPVPDALWRQADLFCFGTLSQRASESRGALRKILEQVSAPVFCDVNLRQQFFSKSLLQDSLLSTDWLKLNDEELPVIAELFGIPAEVEALAERFSLSLVIETLGPRGCEVWHAGKRIHSPAVPATIVSTVGAGDAFSAAFLYAWLTGHTMEEAATAGNLLAAKVAGQTGAF